MTAPPRRGRPLPFQAPCDRCFTVAPLSRYGGDWLCPACNADHDTCQQVAQAITATPTWTCGHGVTYQRGGAP